MTSQALPNLTTFSPVSTLSFWSPYILTPNSSHWVFFRQDQLTSINRYTSLLTLFLSPETNNQALSLPDKSLLMVQTGWVTMRPTCGNLSWPSCSSRQSSEGACWGWAWHGLKGHPGLPAHHHTPSPATCLLTQWLGSLQSQWVSASWNFRARTDLWIII